jgi:hypothetical protein
MSSVATFVEERRDSQSFSLQAKRRKGESTMEACLLNLTGAIEC